MTRSLEPGTVIARYRVAALLGAGGMGEVYLARDESLDRPVALKVLPPDLVTNDERVRRFVQEAKSASSLNHPNIVTIYEIGEADHAAQRVRFIAMELVSGHTLTSLIHQQKVDLRTLVRYLAQAADGLAKAHAAGIVHRDLKPENIMVTSDGFAKVVDFGLAKLTESPAHTGDANAPTVLGRATDAGMVLGTVGYMSPEQVQGKAVDHRSDIFSLGCVLYEAATRERPFQADSDVETLHKILKDAPPAVEALNPNVPADLRRVIRRCLSKNPDRRLQSMKDAALDLAEIDETWETLSVSTGSGTSMNALGTATTSRPRLPMIVALVIGIAGLSFGGWQWFRGSTGPTTATRASLQVTTIARIPDLIWALMSADGRFLAYSANQAGRFSLIVRQLATTQDLVVVPPQGREILLRAIAPDSSYVYYTSRAVAFGPPALYRVPAVGGEPRRILEDANGDVALSADGTRLVAVRENPTELVIANTDGTDPRTLVTANDNRFFAPAWSPDGRYVVAAVARPGVSRERLTAFATDDGREQTIGNADWRITSVVWPAEDTLVVAANDLSAPGGQSQLWSVSWPSGEARRITSDTNNYVYPLGLSADGQTLTTTLVRSGASVYTAPADRPAEAVPLPGEVPDVSFTPLWDGRLLYRTQVRGQGALWVMATDGSRRQRISPERLAVTSVVAAVQADVLVFETAEDFGVTRRLWRMNSSGGGLAELPGDSAVIVIGLSPDGDFLYYRKRDPTAVPPGQRPVWRRPIAGGDEQPVEGAGAPVFSPDGRLFYRVPPGGLAAKSMYSIEIVDATSGRTMRTLSVPTNFAGIRWAPSSDAVLGVRRNDAVSNIWRFPVEGGSGTELTHFGPDEFNGNFIYTADRRLLFFRTERTPGEVVQFKNFR